MHFSSSTVRFLLSARLGASRALSLLLLSGSHLPPEAFHALRDQRRLRRCLLSLLRLRAARGRAVPATAVADSRAPPAARFQPREAATEEATEKTVKRNSRCFCIKGCLLFFSGPLLSCVNFFYSFRAKLIFFIS